MGKVYKSETDFFFKACARAYEARPTITVSTLRALLAASYVNAPMRYSDLSDILDIPIKRFSVKVVGMCEGNDTIKGAFLLTRSQAEDRRHRFLTVSERGKNIADLFDRFLKGDSVKDMPSFKAFARVIRDYPDMAVGTLTVFLCVHSIQEDLLEHQRQGLIGDRFKVSNLSRHINLLVTLDLISSQRSRDDFRGNTLTLSEKGKALMSDIKDALRPKMTKVFGAEFSDFSLKGFEKTKYSPEMIDEDRTRSF